MRTIPVLLPLNDTQKYDLVIDDDGLKRVSVKTSSSKAPSGNYRVELKNCGGGSRGSVIRPFDNTASDILFVYTLSKEIYIIPSIDIKAVSQITLNPELYGKYKVDAKD